MLKSATPPATPAATTQVTGLSQQVQINAGAGVFTGVHWSESTEGAILVDLIPNPKRYLRERPPEIGWPLPLYYSLYVTLKVAF